MRRFLKITAITIGVIFIIISTIIGVTINFIVTPKKLTPIVNDILASTLSQNTELTKAELTFFSTFPNFAVEIDSLIVADSSDVTILSLEKMVVVVNPISYLLTKAVNISDIRLISPFINIAVDKSGKSNLDMFISPTDTTQVDTTSFDLKSVVSSIDVKGIHIESGRVEFDNKLKNTTFSSDSINLELRGAFAEENANLFLDFKSQDINMTLEGKRVIRKFPFAITTNFMLDRKELLVEIDSARTTVGNIVLGTKGTLKADTIRKLLICDLNFGLGTPSLKELIGYIPQTILKPNERLSASGKVVLRGSIKGAYGVDTIPTINSVLTIDNGKFKFDAMEYGVQKLSTKARLTIDGANINKSSLSIDHLNIVSDAGIDISVKSTVSNIFGNFKVGFSVKSKTNLDQVTKVFPMADGIVLKGSNTSDLTGSFDKRSIETKNYGNIDLNGESTFNDMTFIVDGSKVIDSTNTSYLYLAIKEGIFNFGNKSTTAQRTKGESNLSTNIKFSQAGFRNDNGVEVFVEDVEVYAESGVQKDTSSITPMKAELMLGGITLTMPDTLIAELASSKISLAITPYKNDKRLPKIEINLRTDSVSAKALQSNLTGKLTVAGFNAQATPKGGARNKFNYSGKVGFSGLEIEGAKGDKLLTMYQSNLGFDKNRIILKGTPMSIGNSDIEVTGMVENLISNILENSKKDINGTLSIKSDKIDLNDIFAKSQTAFSKYDTTDDKGEVVVADTIPDSELKVFTIPENINTNLTLNIREVLFGKGAIKNVDGKASTKKGVIRLNNLGFFTAGANMNITATYQPKSDSIASAYFDLNAEKIIVEELIGFLPAIDTLMPVLGDIEGVVDFNIVARSEINKSMMLDLQSLQSVIQLDGTNLVMFDSETFRTVSKMLMFKNKKKNVIDSLGLSAIVHKGGKIDVPPFEVEIDRYRAIIGGTQNMNFDTFDIQYKYNISIVKSPLPFKAGVDITGTNGDFDYDITKAKLKRSDFGEIQSKVDSIKLTLKPKN